MSDNFDRLFKTAGWLDWHADEGANFHPGLPIGRKFGSYTVSELIASGGMASVYKAIRSDGEFEKTVAIKLIRMDTGGVESETFLV